MVGARETALDRVPNVGSRDTPPCGDLRDERYQAVLSGPVITYRLSPDELEKYRAMGGPRCNRNRRAITDEAREQALRLVVAGGKSRFDIAREVGLYEAQVDWIIRRAIEEGRIVRTAPGRYEWADAAAQNEEVEAVADQTVEQGLEKQELLSESVVTADRRRELKEQLVRHLVDDRMSVTAAFRAIGVGNTFGYKLLAELQQDGAIKRVAQGLYVRPGTTVGTDAQMEAIAALQRTVVNLQAVIAQARFMTEDRVNELVREQIQPLQKQLDAIASELRRLREQQTIAQASGSDMSQITLRLLDILEAQAGRRAS